MFKNIMKTVGMIGVSIVSSTEYLDLLKTVVVSLTDLHVSKEERSRIARKAIKALPRFFKDLR